MTNVQKYGVVGVIPHDGRWLVIRRSQKVRAPGRICFPGGTIESGEAVEDALVREMQEELAVQVRPVRNLWSSVTPWNVHLTWYHAELLDPVDAIEPNPDEVADAFWTIPHEIGALEGLLESNLDFLAAWQQGEFTLG